MEIIISIAAKIAEYTVAPVGRQFGYIMFYKSNLDKLKTQLENLEAAKDRVQHLTEAAQRNGEEIEVYVQNWLVKAGQKIAEGNNFCGNRGHAMAGCANASFPNLWLRHRLSRKAKKMVKAICETLEGSKFDQISYRPAPSSSILTLRAHVESYEALQSRTLIMDDIMQALKEDNVYSIGVTGLGGVGKSTLVKEFARQAVQNGLFDEVILILITNPLDIKLIQSEIAASLGLKFDEETESGRASRLYDRIQKVKSVLIILDDVQEKLNLAEVGIPFDVDHKGCKLLLTSRNSHVLKIEMGTQRVFQLDILSEQENWSLFEKIAGDIVKNTTFKPTAIEVAKRCAGLPLLIVTVANRLKTMDIHAWKDALTQLSRFDQEGLLHKKVHSVFEWCYNNMESEEQKELFLLFGSSTRSSCIKDLLISAWGLGLFKNVSTLVDARNRLYKLIDDLKAFSLLREGRSKNWVSMHDIIYEAATVIARRIQPFFSVQSTDELKEWPNEECLKKCHRIYLGWCYIHGLPDCLECPQMVELVLDSRDNYLKVPDHFFMQMRELKVLDLGGLNCIPSPPLSLRVLKNLRALYLCKCMLEDITIVAELTSLEILSLNRSEIRRLPRELGQLIHLKLLDLSGCYALRIIPANVISSFTRLEELYMGNCFIPWEVEGGPNRSNNATLGELRHLDLLTRLNILVQDVSTLPRRMFIFEKLERYKIIIGDVWKWTVKHGTSRALQLKLSTSTTNTWLDQGVKLLLNSAEELLLSELKGIRSVLYELNGEGFQQLKHIHIQNNAEMKYIINSMEFRVHPHHAFPELECLLLENLLNFEKICHGTLPMQAFTKLKNVRIQGCHRMQNLFSYSMVKNLTQIRKIEIFKCKSVAEIILQEEGNNNEIDEIKFLHLHTLSLECLPKLLNFCSKPLHSKDYKDSQSTAFFNEKVEFPDLQGLRLIAINFMKIWDDKLSAHSCTQNLTSLIVDKCNMLKALFPSSVARRLVKLRHLEITRCEMLEQIFDPEDQTNNLPSDINPHTLFTDEVIFPNLETFVITDMDNLKSIWPSKLSPRSFSKLGEVTVRCCKKLSDVFPYYMLDKLQSLKKLVVDTCAELEVVFDIQEPNTQTGRLGEKSISLITLSLKNLPKLKHVWSEDPQQTLRFQELGIVKVEECQSLKHVFPLSVAQELLKLQVLEIVNCGVEVIVAKDEVVDNPRLFLPKLTSLILMNLFELGSVYPGKHAFECPKLRKFFVTHCFQLKLFNPQINESGSDVQHHPIPVQKVIASLEKLSLSSRDVRPMWNSQYLGDLIDTVKSLTLHCYHDEPVQFPSDFVLRFNNLEKLIVNCSSFTEIFSSESPNTDQAKTPVITQLRKLKLQQLDKLECIYKEGSLIKPILQNIESLKVILCSSLKNIVPSSILFQNLDTLNVAFCPGLVNLFTSSTARSLLKLRQMTILHCAMMEEIMDNEEDGGANCEIAFMKLRSLELVNLPRLKCFCKGNYDFKFPLLREFLVKECPKMETFCMGVLSTPDLRRVYVKEEIGGWSWQGDLNATIRKAFQQTESEKNGDSHQNPNAEGPSNSSLASYGIDWCSC